MVARRCRTLQVVLGLAVVLLTNVGVVDATVQDDEVTLIHATIVTRHGDRTPEHFLPIDDHAVWRCDDVPSEQGYESEHMPGTEWVHVSYLAERQIQHGTCFAGQLTNAGLQQHQALGASLRQRYLASLRLDDPARVFVRSTDVARTIQSAHGLLHGLVQHADSITTWTMDPDGDNMWPNSRACPRLRQLINARTSSDAWKAKEEEMKPVHQQFQAAFLGHRVPGWSSLFDSLFARRSHSLPLPHGVTEDMYQAVVDYANWYQPAKYGGRDDLTKLAIGDLLREIQLSLHAAVTDDPERKDVVLLSGHDTTVAPLAFAVGIPEARVGWPPYASALLIELYRSKTEASQHYVQVVLNGEPFVIPGCDAALCDYATVLQAWKPMVPTDYHAECRASSHPSDLDVNANAIDVDDIITRPWSVSHVFDSVLS